MTNIIELADKDMLLALKNELSEKTNDPKDILKKYKNQYEINNYEKYTCNISFGYNKDITNFQKSIKKIKPYSNIQNYPKIREARGPWQIIYNIAFVSGETLTLNPKIKKAKTKELIKEAI